MEEDEELPGGFNAAKIYDGDNVVGATQLQINRRKYYGGTITGSNPALVTAEIYNAYIKQDNRTLAKTHQDLTDNISWMTTELARWHCTEKNIENVKGEVIAQENALVRQATNILSRAQSYEATNPGTVKLVQGMLETLSSTSGLDLMSGDYAHIDFAVSAMELKQALSGMIEEAVKPWGAVHESSSRRIIEGTLESAATLLSANAYYRNFPLYNEDNFMLSIAEKCKFVLNNASIHGCVEETNVLLETMGKASGVDLLKLTQTYAKSAKVSKTRVSDSGIG